MTSGASLHVAVAHWRLNDRIVLLGKPSGGCKILRWKFSIRESASRHVEPTCRAYPRGKSTQKTLEKPTNPLPVSK
jgi:hypothetical protein